MIGAQGRPTILNSENALRSPVRHNNHQQAESGLKDHDVNKENIRSSPRKPVDVYEDEYKRPVIHKKTKSSVSLKSLIGNDKAKPPKLSRQDPEDVTKLKRPKSSTGLSALLSRSKAPKETKLECKGPTKDKENRTPPQTADMVPSPIWAQFATQQTPEPRKSTAISRNNRNDVEREIALYTPKEYSPSKQRNFHDYHPTLSRKPEPSSGPLSEIISACSTKALMGMSTPSLKKQPATGPEQTYSLVSTRLAEGRTKENPRPTDEKGPEDTKEAAHTEKELAEITSGVASPAAAKVKRGSRVMAAVAAFNGTRDEVRDVHSQNSTSPGIDTQSIENEFETLLVSQQVQQSRPFELTLLLGNEKHTAQCTR